MRVVARAPKIRLHTQRARHGFNSRNAHATGATPAMRTALAQQPQCARQRRHMRNAHGTGAARAMRTPRGSTRNAHCKCVTSAIRMAQTSHTQCARHQCHTRSAHEAGTTHAMRSTRAPGRKSHVSRTQCAQFDAVSANRFGCRPQCGRCDARHARHGVSTQHSTTQPRTTTHDRTRPRTPCARGALGTRNAHHHAGSTHTLHGRARQRAHAMRPETATTAVHTTRPANEPARKLPVTLRPRETATPTQCMHAPCASMQRQPKQRVTARCTPVTARHGRVAPHAKTSAIFAAATPRTFTPCNVRTLHGSHDAHRACTKAEHAA